MEAEVDEVYLRYLKFFKILPKPTIFLTILYFFEP